MNRHKRWLRRIVFAFVGCLLVYWLYLNVEITYGAGDEPPRISIALSATPPTETVYYGDEWTYNVTVYNDSQTLAGPMPVVQLDERLTIRSIAVYGQDANVIQEGHKLTVTGVTIAGQPLHLNITVRAAGSGPGGDVPLKVTAMQVNTPITQTLHHWLVGRFQLFAPFTAQEGR